MQKLLFLVSEDSYFCSHRLSLAEAAKAAGFMVFVACRFSKHKALIESKGIYTIPLHTFSRTGILPWKEAQCLWELYQIYRHIRPEIVHHVAMKPVLYGTVVARLCQIPRIINAFGGLGYLFTESVLSYKKIILKKMICFLFRLVFNTSRVTLLLQNRDDSKVLLSQGCAQIQQISIVRGVGIATQLYPVLPPPAEPPVIISLIARMLWDKGIGELVEAARWLKSQQLNFQIELYGLPDPENPSSISEKQLETWKNEGVVNWHGFTNNAMQAYINCHIAVLPSYREGFPKTLLEAAACGRPLVATDVPGCREIVQPHVNGFLVPVKNPLALAKALYILIQDKALRLQMGKQSRMIVEKNFKESDIHAQTLALYQGIK